MSQISVISKLTGVETTTEGTQGDAANLLI